MSLPCEGVDLDVFFPTIGGEIAYREARQVCARCRDEVAAACLAITMENEPATMRYGFAGRMTPTEREDLHRARRRAAREAAMA